ncbi:MAG: DNA/RNA non-specific endonuclease [Bacteroidota bacterium]
MSRQLEYISRSTKKYKESVEKLWETYRTDLPNKDESVLHVARGDVEPESIAGGYESPQFHEFEAIILAKLRPAYFIIDDLIKMSNSPVEEDDELVCAIVEQKEKLEKIARSVGRVDLFNHWSQRYAGTGWLIDDNIAVTNRHVARIFAETGWAGSYRFKKGTFNEEMEVRLDYARQHDCGMKRRADVLEVLYIAKAREADIAFLRVETRGDVEPIPLLEWSPSSGAPIAVIGYPAKDGGRNDPALMERLFGDVYDVKRFAPGYVVGTEENGVIVTSDYTSLGGNSGSPVIDLETGKAAALHFAGAFRDVNHAVAADIVAAARARIVTKITVKTPKKEPSSVKTAFENREGYQASFLGDGELAVPLPSLGPWASDVAPVSDDENNILKYRHFSVFQSATRRLPLMTAVNIDGEKAFKLKRKGSWRLDKRIAKTHQVGNAIYVNNPLDKGHLVRRMDPGWGKTQKEAMEGETDTFHYTVCAPQHSNLNQREWLGLEDYILEATRTKGFKASVFTGPVFRDEDKTLRNQPGAEDIAIPEEFWKIAVIVNAETGKLSATGYILSHGKMIRNLTEAAFVYGEYETYQVQIAKIESETGLDFGKLRDADPLGPVLDVEAPFDAVIRRISGPDTLKLA